VLRHLRVTNFAILSDVSLELGPGMNVLTGETGAGKSLIVEAVALLRGARASADIPRAGADEAVVEAVVEIPADLRKRVRAVLDGAGLPSSDEDVVIRRVIHRGGRSRTWINGGLTTAARLAEVGALLIDLSGQHQHQGLVDPGRHRELLDALAARRTRGDVAPEVTAMEIAWDALRALDDELATLDGDDRTRAARLDIVRFQLDELDAIKVEPGEETRLDAERVRLAAVDQLGAGARAAEDALYGGDDSAVDRLGAAARELDKLVRLDGELAGCARSLGEARALVEDVAAQLRSYAERLDGDPERLAWVDDRLAAIKRLARKHARASTEELIAIAHALRAELDALAGRDARLTELAATREAALARAEAAARALTAVRATAARTLEKEVGEALSELGLAGARLAVAIEPRPLGATGADKVELLLAANKGEDARPLARIASGGELSRIMLALKLALRRADEVATYVFDEVDAGIGGSTAHAVGRQIAAVADHRQVLCVTHLPQIAAHAHHHFHVEKSVVGGRTETHVEKLSAAARKDELARMLGGESTARARAHAAELLAKAKKPVIHERHGRGSDRLA
jgi:DNA repair protein RecN (Recombination protein N)